MKLSEALTQLFDECGDRDAGTLEVLAVEQGDYWPAKRLGDISLELLARDGREVGFRVTNAGAAFTQLKGTWEYEAVGAGRPQMMLYQSHAWVRLDPGDVFEHFYEFVPGDRWFCVRMSLGDDSVRFRVSPSMETFRPAEAPAAAQVSG